MSTKKSYAIALIMTAMFVIILVCLFLLKAWIICGILIGGVSVLGLICATTWLISWMEKQEPEEDLDPPAIVADPETQEQVAATVDEIMAEVKG